MSKASVGEIRAGEACAVEVRAGEVRASEVDGLLVLPGVAAPYDSYGGLNIGGVSSLRVRQLPAHRRPTVPAARRVLADECRQDRHDRGVVPGRVEGDALQCVYATDAHVLLVGA